MIANTLAILFTVAYLGITLWLCRGLHFTSRSLCLGAIAIALTCVLSYLYIPLPTGADITLGSWVPLMVLALVCDYRLAMVSGFVCGIVALLILPGWGIAHWAQFFLEYLTIFSAMGYAGLRGYQKRSDIISCALLAILLRFTAQVLSGVVFYGAYAWEGWGAWGYSLIYHLSGKIPEGILTIAILLALPLKRFAAFAHKGEKLDVLH